MQDFPANSNKAKAGSEPREPIKPVTTAETVRRKRGLGRQFKETFFGGTGRDALSYMVQEVVIPSIRDTIHDAMQSGLDRLIYGETQKTRRTGISSGNPAHISYNKMAPSSKPTAQRTLSRQSRARFDFDDIVISKRNDATEVIDRMYEILSRYGSVSVADLFELTGLQSSHTDMKWGWTDLRGAKALPTRQGTYILDLPEPEPLG